MKRIWMFAAMTICLFSCGQDAKQSEPQTEKKAEKEVAIVEDKWLVLDFDEVRVREEAGMESKVLITLQAGSKMKDLGGRSDFETTVKLRGEDRTSTWFQIETQNGIQGWIFGGTVSPTSAPDKNQVSSVDFDAELKKLDKKDCASIEKAIEVFKNSFKNQSGLQNDKEVESLKNFIQSIVGQANRELENRPYFDDFYLINYNPEGKPIPKGMTEDVKRWEKCGMKMFFAEGSPYLKERPGIVLDEASEVLSANMRRYLAQEKIEEDQVWADDGGLTIPIQKVAERAIFWEKFATDLPSFIFTEDAIEKQKVYTGCLLGGLDNTPAFAYGSKPMLEDDYKAVYNWVMKMHPNTKTSKTISEYYELLKQTNFQNNDKARKYLERFWQ